MSSTTNTHIPLQLHKLFTNVTEACNEEERRQIVADLKERHQYPISLKDDGLLETFNDLYLSGKLTNNDLGILYITAQKSQNKDQIISCLDEFKRSQPFESQDFIGRSKEKQDLLELFSDQTTYGVNIHGVQGVGKTTLAKEIVKEFDQDSWETIAFDLREAKDIDTAYLFMLCTLGHSAFSNMNEMEDVRERARNTVLGHLQNKCSKNQKLLLLFDNIESELIEHFKDELISFFDAIIDSEACKTGIMQIILTSKLVIPVVSIRNYSLEALPSSTSKDLICRKSKIDLQSKVLKDDEQETLTKVAEFCRNIPYLLEGAEHMLRNGFITPHELLQKIEAQINQGVPVEYVTTKALFDSIPTYSLKNLATKLCVFPKPFSLSEVKDIAELKSDYDALLDLEYLTNHGVISKVVTEIKTDDDKAESKAEYDVHSLFKDFAASFLRVQFPVYQESYNEAEIKFGNYFSDRLLSKLTSADDKHVHVLQHDEESFDAVLRLNLLDFPRLLEKLIHTIPQHETICRITMLLNSLHSDEKMTTYINILNILKTWADVLENQGDLLSSARVRCLEFLQLTDMKWMTLSELDKATSLLVNRTEACIHKMSEKVLTNGEKMEAAYLTCLFQFCKGKLHYIRSQLIGNTVEKENLLKSAIANFGKALNMNKSHINENDLAVELLKSLSDCQEALSHFTIASDYLKKALALPLGTNDTRICILLYNKLAFLYGKMGDYLSAKAYLEKVLDSGNMGDKELGLSDKAIMSNNLGIIYLKLGHYSQAISCFEETLVELIADNANTAVVHRNLGSAYMELKDYSKAISCYENALGEYQLIGDKANTAMAHRNLGSAHMKLKHYFKAKSCFEEAVKEFDLIGDKANIALVYKALGRTCMEMKHNHTGRSCFQKALENFELIGDKANTALVYKALGSAHVELEDYFKAISCFKKALVEYELIGDNADTALVQRDLGSAYMELKVYSKAIPCFEKAAEEFELIGDKANTALVFKALGITHMELKHYSKAISCFKKALKEFKIIGDKANTALVHRNLDSAHLQLKNYSKASEYLHKAETVESDYDNIAQRYSEFADRCHRQRKYEEAKLRYEKAIKITNRPSLVLILYEKLANTLLALEQYDYALDCAHKALNLCVFEKATETRILHLMGIINERKEDYPAALLNYKEAFKVVELLPDIKTHSSEVLSVCDKLTDMCEKCKEIGKLEEYKPRIELLKQRLFTEMNQLQQEGHFTLLVDEHGGTFKLSNYGVLKIPSGALKQQTKLTIRPVSKDVPSPAGELDAVVSSMIQFEPNNLILEKPIEMTLVHCGPQHTAHYENVAMGYNDVTNTWEQLEETKQPSSTNSLQIQLTKLTAVAVVTRLITDTFRVPVIGCKVKSSVCPNVTLEFPHGAVDKLTEGSLKVLPMTDVLQPDIPQGLHFGPMIVVNGFKDTVFNKDVTLTVPYPDTCRPVGHERDVGQIHVMRYDGTEWKDVTDDEKCLKSESTIEIRVKHFSVLQIVLDTAKTAVIVPICIFLLTKIKQLFPKSVNFAVYKNTNVSPQDGCQLSLVLTKSSDKETKLKIYEDSSDYKNLGHNSDPFLKHNAFVYVTVQGGFEMVGDNTLSLQFREDEAVNKQLHIRPRPDSDEDLTILISSNENELNGDVCKLFVFRSALGFPPRQSTQAADQPTTSGTTRPDTVVQIEDD